MQTTSVRTLTKMSLCVALCCIAGNIVFPLPFTPTMVTALTIVLSLTAYILPPRQTFTVILVYLLLGAAGVPIFAGTGGIARLVGPTGGFYFAWLIAYPLLSAANANHVNFKRYLLTNILIAMPITYAGGLISMSALMDVSLWQAATMAVFPFIAGDILKAAAAAFLALKLNPSPSRSPL